LINEEWSYLGGVVYSVVIPYFWLNNFVISFILFHIALFSLSDLIFLKYNSQSSTYPTKLSTSKVFYKFITQGSICSLIALISWWLLDIKATNSFLFKWKLLFFISLMGLTPYPLRNSFLKLVMSKGFSTNLYNVKVLMSSSSFSNYIECISCSCSIYRRTFLILSLSFNSSGFIVSGTGSLKLIFYLAFIIDLDHNYSIFS